MKKENRVGLWRSGENIRSLVLMNVLLLVFLFLLILVHPIDQLRKYETKRERGDNKTNILIYGDRVLSQTFVSGMGSDSFEIFIEANEENYHGDFYVTLKDEQQEVIRQWKTDKLDLISGLQGRDGWICYDAGHVFETGKQYTIEIAAPELEEESALSLVTYNDYNGGDAWTCFLNGEKTESILSFSLYKQSFNFFFLGAVLLLFAVANLWWINRKKPVEKTALWILLGTGLIMFLIMAPGSQPDEIYHFSSAYKLSNVILGKKENVNLADESMIRDLRQHYNENDSFIKYLDILRRNRTNEEGVKADLDRSDNLNHPIAYLAPAAGITVVRLFHGNQIQAYTLARLFTLLSYVLMCMIAIRWVPAHKHLFLLICIIPMAMHQAVSTSRDVFVNGMSLVFTAWVFKLIREDKPFTARHVLSSILMLGLFGPVKGAGCILALLTLAVPVSHFKSRGDKIRKVTLIIAGTLAVFALTEWNTIFKSLTASDYAGKSDYYHIDFLFSHPLRSLRLILNLFGTYGWHYIEQAVGLKLAGTSLGIREYLILGYLGILLLTAWSSKEEERLFMGKQKRLLIMTALVGYLLTALSFIFSDTPYGATLIEGIQGRYLIPFAAPFLFGLCNGKIKVQTESYKLMYAVWFVELGFIVCVMSSIRI